MDKKSGTKCTTFSGNIRIEYYPSRGTISKSIARRRPLELNCYLKEGNFNCLCYHQMWYNKCCFFCPPRAPLDFIGSSPGGSIQMQGSKDALVYVGAYAVGRLVRDGAISIFLGCIFSWHEYLYIDQVFQKEC